MTTTPATMLRDTLATLSMSQAELCRRSGLSTKHVNQIAQGKNGVTPAVAMLFERVLGVPAKSWNAVNAEWKTAQLKEAAMTEAAFQARVMDYAKLRGWRCVHHRPAQQRGKWITAVSGDVGAPNLVLARGGRVLLVELKSETGRLGPGQAEWLDAADANGRLWRPSHWDTIVKELR